MLVGQAVHEVLAVLLKRLLRNSDPIDQGHFGRCPDPPLWTSATGIRFSIDTQENREQRVPVPKP
jgi:hypothetical protein